MQNKTNYSYYKIDTGCYPDIIKLCFTREQFKSVLDDHRITEKIEALEVGCAETHIIQLKNNTQLIVLIFDLEDICRYGIDGLAGVVAHEVSHCVDHLAEYINEESNLSGGETRAYLTEHFVSQIFKACILERDKHVGKNLGKKITESCRKTWWSLFQVDQHGDRSTRQDSDSKDEGVLRRDEDPIWQGVTKTGADIPNSGKARVPSGDIKKRGRD